MEKNYYSTIMPFILIEMVLLVSLSPYHTLDSLAGCPVLISNDEPCVKKVTQQQMSLMNLRQATIVFMENTQKHDVIPTINIIRYLRKKAANCGLLHASASSVCELWQFGLFTC